MRRLRRAKNGYASAALCAGLALVALGGLSHHFPAGAETTPVEAGMLPPARTDIPVPPNAREVVTIAPSPTGARVMLERLGSAEANAVRGLSAVVFRLPAPVNVGEVMRWYAATEPAVQAVSAPPAPSGTGAAAVPDVIRVPGAVAAQIGIRPLASQPGYLVVSVAPYPGRPGDARVTAVRVEGSPVIVQFLDQVAAIVARPAGRPRPSIGFAQEDDAAFPGSLVERDITLPASDVPVLLRQVEQSTASAPVRAMYESILRSAESIRLTTYRVRRHITPQEFLQHYRAVGRRLAWGEVTSDATNTTQPMLIFTLGDGRGIVMIRGKGALSTMPMGSPSGVVRFIPTTEISILVVEGKVDVKALRGR